MTDFFASDDWQPAEWLRALDRLAPAPEVPASGKMLDAATKVPERMIEYLLFQPDIVPSCTCSGDCENTLVFMLDYQHYHVEISTIGMLNVEYYTLAGEDLCRLVRDECLPLVQRLSYLSLHCTRLNKYGHIVVFMLAVEVKDDPQHQGRFMIEVLGMLEQRGADLIVVPPPPVLEVSI